MGCGSLSFFFKFYGDDSVMTTCFYFYLFFICDETKTKTKKKGWSVNNKFDKMKKKGKKRQTYGINKIRWHKDKNNRRDKVVCETKRIESNEGHQLHFLLSGENLATATATANCQRQETVGISHKKRERIWNWGRRPTPVFDRIFFLFYLLFSCEQNCTVQFLWHDNANAL